MERSPPPPPCHTLLRALFLAGHTNFYVLLNKLPIFDHPGLMEMLAPLNPVAAFNHDPLRMLPTKFGPVK